MNDVLFQLFIIIIRPPNSDFIYSLDYSGFENVENLVNVELGNGDSAKDGTFTAIIPIFSSFSYPLVRAGCLPTSEIKIVAKDARVPLRFIY